MYIYITFIIIADTTKKFIAERLHNIYQDYMCHARLTYYILLLFVGPKPYVT